MRGSSSPGAPAPASNDFVKVVHLTDSPFFGGPERQMLGLAVALPAHVHTTVLCFRDGGTSISFIERLRAAGVPARMLDHANPRFLAMLADITRELRAEQADVLVCHGYKADILGWVAARRLGVRVMSVSRGWTAHTWKVRINETLDRRMLHLMDRVVCVSEGQAEKVRAAGVPVDRVRVIHNSIDTSRFDAIGNGRAELDRLFSLPPGLIVIAVGRLSPEKAFEHLIEAARVISSSLPDVGFVLVGDGPERERLTRLVRDAGLEARFVMTGFRSDVDRLISGADVLAQSSRTEGLPNVVLEGCAAGVAVVATDVGGTREVIRDGFNGLLVPPGEPDALAARLLDLLRAPERRALLGVRGREIVREQFSFARQSALYEALFDEIIAGGGTRTTPALPPATAGGSAA
jgi:glycosyltransferase involved in cell wall biosynthesis